MSEENRQQLERIVKALEAMPSEAQQNALAYANGYADAMAKVDDEQKAS